MFGPCGLGWRTGSAASSHRVCKEGGKKGEFQRKETAPSKNNSGSLSASIQHAGERRVGAHFSHFLAIKAIVSLKFRLDLGLCWWQLKSPGARGGIQGELHFAWAPGVELFLSISGSLHFLLLARQGFPKPSLAAEGICSKGHLGFVKNKPGTVWRDLWVGIWRIKDEPTETEGKRAMRKQELQEMQFKKKKSTSVAFKITPFCSRALSWRSSAHWKGSTCPWVAFKKEKKQKTSKQNCVLNLQYVSLVVSWALYIWTII